MMVTSEGGGGGAGENVLAACDRTGDPQSHAANSANTSFKHTMADGLACARKISITLSNRSY